MAKKAGKGKGMTTIKIKPNTQVRLKDFSDGLGATYDKMLNFLLDEVRGGDESDVLAGVRLRDKFKARNAVSDSDDDEE